MGWECLGSTRFQCYCFLYITDILMIYDAIEGGMVSITIIFKFENEIHQPSLWGQ